MINYNERKLHAILGGPVKVESEIDRMTARAITDSNIGISAEMRFRNVRAWIDEAYKLGFVKGREISEQNFSNKIKKIFGVL